MPVWLIIGIVFLVLVTGEKPRQGDQRWPMRIDGGGDGMGGPRATPAAWMAGGSVNQGLFGPGNVNPYGAAGMQPWSDFRDQRGY